MTVEQTSALSERDVIDALDGLPPRRLHAAALGREVIQQLSLRLTRHPGASEDTYPV